MLFYPQKLVKICYPIDKTTKNFNENWETYGILWRNIYIYIFLNREKLITYVIGVYDVYIISIIPDDQHKYGFCISHATLMSLVLSRVHFSVINTKYSW